MKVLWFANTPCEAAEYLMGDKIKSGGWLYALCEQLKNQCNIQLHIAFFWGEEKKAFIYKGVTYHPILREGERSKLGRYFNRIIGQFSSTNDKKEKIRCLRIVKDVAPDLIHIHGSEESFGLITYEETISTPIVLSIQGLLSAYEAKYYSGLSKHALRNGDSILRQIMCDGVNSRYRNFCRRAEREIEVFKSLQYVIGRTQWDERCAKALNPRIQYYSVNEILRAEFMHAQTQEYPLSSPLVILSTISSGVYKGLEVVYQTANILTNLQFPFEWKIIGLSSGDDMVRIVERSCSLCAKTMHIDLLGTKSADEMVKIMQSSNLYVQVSHIENSPNSLCEAMVMGMPIIASFAGGTSSMLQDGTEGVLIQDGNSYELAGAIMEVEKNYNEYVAMGQNARKRALKRHSPENVITELMMVYNKLVG